jgi:pimeloyl-ACP methyl ester carboxylesterase
LVNELHLLDLANVKCKKSGNAAIVEEMKMKRILLLIALVSISGLTFAADYAREKKWADEVVPGVVVGDPVYLEQADGHKFLTIYTPVKDAKAALVIVHGRGVNPDWGLIGALRSELPDHGYTTLSVQMPVLENSANDSAYLATFPDAVQRLHIAVDFLKAKGYTKIGLVSHSMGSRMSARYITDKPDAAVQAWVAIGMSERVDYSKTSVAVLDLYGEHDLPAVLKTARARNASLQGKAGSTQQQVAHADHFFDNMDAQLVDAVAKYLDQRF